MKYLIIKSCARKQINVQQRWLLFRWEKMQTAKTCNQCQMFICGNGKAGCLCKHIQVQRTGLRDMHTQIPLGLLLTLIFFFSCLTSRRKVYDQKSPLRRRCSSPVVQSSKQDGRMVSQSLYFRLPITLIDFNKKKNPRGANML